MAADWRQAQSVADMVRKGKGDVQHGNHTCGDCPQQLYGADFPVRLVHRGTIGTSRPGGKEFQAGATSAVPELTEMKSDSG